MAHVLVVDDDTDIRMTIRTLLENVGGHTMQEAPDGLAALEILRSSAQRLVVSVVPKPFDMDVLLNVVDEANRRIADAGSVGGAA